MLRDWLRLAGQLNWALNVYPWLRPGLGGIYVKTVGNAQMWGRIKINKMVWWELAWFIEHVQQSSGLFFFILMVWQEGDVGHSMLTIHVNASVQGLCYDFLYLPTFPIFPDHSYHNGPLVITHDTYAYSYSPFELCFTF